MKHFIIIAILFALTSATCSDNIGVKEIEYKGIKKTTLQKASFTNAAIRADLEYHNPNAFGIDVKDADLQLFLNDKFIGTADQPEVTKVPAKSTFIFPVVAHFNPLKLLGTALGVLGNKTNKLTIKGTARVGKGGIYIKIPINVTEDINLQGE
jgi:LEA14-like dessication related protein